MPLEIILVVKEEEEEEEEEKDDCRSDHRNDFGHNRVAMALAANSHVHSLPFVSRTEWRGGHRVSERGGPTVETSRLCDLTLWATMIAMLCPSQMHRSRARISSICTDTRTPMDEASKIP